MPPEEGETQEVEYVSILVPHTDDFGFLFVESEAVEFHSRFEGEGEVLGFFLGFEGEDRVICVSGDQSSCISILVQEPLIQTLGEEDVC